VRPGNFYREFDTQLFYVLTNTHLDLALLPVRAGGVVMDAYSGLLYVVGLLLGLLLGDMMIDTGLRRPVSTMTTAARTARASRAAVACA
jgi:hypothetical protein